MDSMRNNQFQEEHDGAAVERPADVTDFLRAKVAGIDSGHELRSDWLEPSLPMLRDDAAATGSRAALTICSNAPAGSRKRDI